MINHFSPSGLVQGRQKEGNEEITRKGTEAMIPVDPAMLAIRRGGEVAAVAAVETMDTVAEKIAETGIKDLKLLRMTISTMSEKLITHNAAL